MNAISGFILRHASLSFSTLLPKRPLLHLYLHTMRLNSPWRPARHVPRSVLTRGCAPLSPAPRTRGVPEGLSSSRPGSGLRVRGEQCLSLSRDATCHLQAGPMEKPLPNMDMGTGWPGMGNRGPASPLCQPPASFSASAQGRAQSAPVPQA